MARLLIQSAELGGRALELKLGVNRIGRSAKNDFPIEHPSVSARHCEIILANEGVTVRDCESTNGTFVNGRRIEQATLSAGQTLQLGEVALLVDNTDVNISIPQFDIPRPAPPVVLTDGSLICPRHPKARATHQCTHCHEVLCDACIHWLRRRGGKLMKFCPLCSHACLPLGEEKAKKKSFLGLWRKTTKLPLFDALKRKRGKSTPGDET